MKALAAEVVRNFSSRLLPLGISVRELTGDMQLTKYEIQNTQVMPLTPLNPYMTNLILDDSNNSREMGCRYEEVDR